MKIAVVGAGFCGIAACFELLQIQGAEVSLFDARGIGKGASGIAAGLLHPYLGEQGKRSWKADEALAATLQLIEVAEKALGQKVAERSGVLRKGKIETLYEDVVPLSHEVYLINSGVTVYSQLYLEGLWKSCTEKGAALHLQKISSLEDLKEYDWVVLAAGAGVVSFQECQHLRLGKTKGQVLVCSLPENITALERSVVGKGYLAKSEQARLFCLGSTYERGSLSEGPCLETAALDLIPKASTLDERLKKFDILECRAGIRISRAGHYIPLLEQINKKCFAITGMGSRGLLYHAFFAKMLKEKIQIA